MANAVTFKKVIVDHTGSCGRYNYLAGQPTELPEEVLQALGSDSYKEVEQDEVGDVIPYKDLQARAKELDLPTNKSRKELEELIAAKEAEQEGKEE